MMAMHNPPIPVIPRAVRVFLACRISRMVIMRVSKMLSATEIERYGRLKSMAVVFQELSSGCEI